MKLHKLHIPIAFIGQMNNDSTRIDFDKSIFATTWIYDQMNEAMIDLREYTKGIP